MGDPDDSLNKEKRRGTTPQDDKPRLIFTYVFIKEGKIEKLSMVVWESIEGTVKARKCCFT